MNSFTGCCQPSKLVCVENIDAEAIVMLVFDFIKWLKSLGVQIQRHWIQDKLQLNCALFELHPPSLCILGSVQDPGPLSTRLSNNLRFPFHLIWNRFDTPLHTPKKSKSKSQAFVISRYHSYIALHPWSSWSPPQTIRMWNKNKKIKYIKYRWTNLTVRG
jgi:hypothetical protein